MPPPEETSKKNTREGGLFKKPNTSGFTENRKSKSKSVANEMKGSKSKEGGQKKTPEGKPTGVARRPWHLFRWKSKQSKNKVDIQDKADKVDIQNKVNGPMSGSKEHHSIEIDEPERPIGNTATRIAGQNEAKVQAPQKLTADTSERAEVHNTCRKQTPAVRCLPPPPKKPIYNKNTSSNHETTIASVHHSKNRSSRVSGMPEVDVTTPIDPILFQAPRPTPKVNVTAQTANRRQPVGLINLGTSCFFNAVMQNLNQTFLLHDLNKQSCNGPLSQSLFDFYTKMTPGSQRTVNPSDLFVNICRRSNKFSRGQCDSHELLRHLLDGLRIEERQASGSADNRKMLTNVDRVFGGHLLTVYVCETCQQPYHVCEPMLDISLPIAFMTDGQSKSLFSQTKSAYQEAAKCLMEPLSGELRNSRKSKPYSVETCLEAFTRTEAISNEYLCIACNDELSKKGKTDYCMTSATKRTLVYNPPAILTLHLKRFEQKARGFVKCNDRITFEETLNLGPYCTSFCKRNRGNETSIWYSLYGLVEHSGSLSGGHYVAYVKMRTPNPNIQQFLQQSFLDRDQLTEEKLVQRVMKLGDRLKQIPRKESAVDGEWFYISDGNCEKVKSISRVLNCQAYLLFYERLVGDEGSRCQRTRI